MSTTNRRIDRGRDRMRASVSTTLAQTHHLVLGLDIGASQRRVTPARYVCVGNPLVDLPSGARQKESSQDAACAVSTKISLIIGIIRGARFVARGLQCSTILSRRTPRVSTTKQQHAPRYAGAPRDPQQHGRRRSVHSRRRSRHRTKAAPPYQRPNDRSIRSAWRSDEQGSGRDAACAVSTGRRAVGSPWTCCGRVGVGVERTVVYNDGALKHYGVGPPIPSR